MRWVHISSISRAQTNFTHTMVFPVLHPHTSILTFQMPCARLCRSWACLELWCVCRCLTLRTNLCPKLWRTSWRGTKEKRKRKKRRSQTIMNESSFFLFCSYRGVVTKDSMPPQKTISFATCISGWKDNQIKKVTKQNIITKTTHKLCVAMA